MTQYVIVYLGGDQPWQNMWNGQPAVRKNTSTVNSNGTVAQQQSGYTIIDVD